ncbi:T-cell surface protein tactile precursor [Camelus ferus]|nr:T-cell surface protein tactile precursor [Camelus ferus]
MERKWTYCAVYSIIQIHFVRGILEETFNAEEDIYALPGSDVSLTCQTRKKGFLVQMQWSKVTDKVDLIALYHPEHGFYCGSRSRCESLVAFRVTPGSVSQWTLHLKNMSSSLTGKYECSFTMYPEGIQTKIYNLFIQTNGRQHHRLLDPLCGYKGMYFASGEDSGTQETLITQDHPISNSTLFKDRVKLGTDYALYLSPVQIHDDDRKFSCHVEVRPGRILRSFTTVKVFAKPETPMIVENNSMDVFGEVSHIKAFENLQHNVPSQGAHLLQEPGPVPLKAHGELGPLKPGVLALPGLTMATLLQLVFVHAFQMLPQGCGAHVNPRATAHLPATQAAEMHITNEERKDRGGFLELKSVLTYVYDSKPAQLNNLTIWCMALSPVPGNKVWNNSSEKITFSLGPENPPTEPLLRVVESTVGTQPSLANSISPTTSNSDVTTRGFSYSETSSGKDVKYCDVFNSTTRAFSEVPTTANGSTKNNDIHITGIVVNKPKDGMSWPVIVAALLFSCLVLFGLGVRKWCQYQKEMGKESKQ